MNLSRRLKVNTSKTLSSQQGQSVVEGLLLMTIFVIVVTIVSSQAKSQEWFGQLASKPWIQIAGMMQNGVWESPEEGMNLHPNHTHRHISLRGDDP